MDFLIDFLYMRFKIMRAEVILEPGLRKVEVFFYFYPLSTLGYRLLRFTVVFSEISNFNVFGFREDGKTK